jgi:hypothetical protein
MMGNLQGFAARHHQSCIEISMPEKSQKLRDQSWQTSSILRSHPNRLWSLSRLKQIWHRTSHILRWPIASIGQPGWLSSILCDLAKNGSD